VIPGDFYYVLHFSLYGVEHVFGSTPYKLKMFSLFRWILNGRGSIKN